MSQTLLSTRLKELERVGIVERRGNQERTREYHLTEAGCALAPLIHQLGEWGLRYAQICSRKVISTLPFWYGT